jgi:L-amino acid N-acyltransferase YncA
MSASGRGAPELHVRRATPADAAGVARVLNEAIADGRFTILDRPFSVEDEAAYITGLGPRGFVNVAETPGGDIVGVQTIAPLDDAVGSQDHVATMGTWVLAAWRRRGVGRALFAAGAAAARELGYAKVFTDLRADNEVSLAFHTSLGFTVAGRARRHVRIGGRDIDALLIETEL